MFVSKVHDQKVELLRAVFRNMYLKEKCDYLDSECKMLAEQVLTNQVTKEEKNEVKLLLEKELNDLRQLQEEKLHALTLANEKITQMFLLEENSKLTLSECKSMDETLEFKDDMIKCLQEELVCVRLNAAEKWAQIRDLKQYKDELENDKEMMTNKKPETVARLQEELITAKILQIQYSKEFDNIKKEVERIKTEILAHKKECNGKVEGKVDISQKGAKWRKKNDDDKDINNIENEITKLKEEKQYLQKRIPDLESKIDILNKHLKFKEEEKHRLQEKLNSINIKYQSTQSITLERKRQCAHLENTASQKVKTIRNSSSEKKESIDDLSSKLFNAISQRRQSISSYLEKREFTLIQDLEEQIEFLEQKIKQLNLENMKLHPEACSNGNYSDQELCTNDT